MSRSTASDPDRSRWDKTRKEKAIANEPASKTLRPFISSLEIGAPISHLNLTLIPLKGDGHAGLDYILGADAIEADTLTVTEVSEGGSIPELLVTSTAEEKILLLDGEELIGAKQNRILNTSILLPPEAGVKIPVSCVERGRWRRTSRRFGSGGYSPARLRALKSKHVTRSLRERGVAASDQGAVWDEVARCMSEAGTSSPTGAMHDAIHQRRASLEEYVHALEYPKGARGVVAAIDGNFAALDLLDRSETLERIWRRFVTGCALDAIRVEQRRGEPLTAEDVEVLL